MFALLYVSSAVVWKCGSDTLKVAWCWAGGNRISQGTANVFRLYCRSGRIPKSPCLILAHLSLFSLASTMSSSPRRIIGLHCRRQTIYWHFASLNNTVCLPAPIHFTVRTIRHPTHTHRLNGHQLMCTIHTETNKHLEPQTQTYAYAAQTWLNTAKHL